MPSVRFRVAFGILSALWLSGCGGSGQYFVAKDEPWRATEERACLASGAVQESPFIKTKLSLGGPTVCGAERPFELAATDGGRVTLQPAALLRCPMIPQVNRWVQTSIQPAAMRAYGAPLVELKIAGSYACRPMNHVSGAYLSEHGHANALDVSGFVLADGRSISVKRGWRGDYRDRAFLRAVHDGACQHFTTVLSPDYDANHHDHFHVDLARRGPDGLKTVCK
ncbi:MAG: extensin family protein [Hyphomicrobium sp.]|uniref:extensin-like domain-containing protein n=1 Tax=Hyphomicrobium sp. TaxID=82 RepID=UPI001327E143|nr:extensin family protein [Hyphomicrobium sp.]KAB2942348.1 MAG: extensin family protein [Hyphomicrobium sp.]MBZ0212117.1 extensin family protein [Hyphomicrobium sp.]